MSVQGITEQDIANYLANTPGFFERHAELLATVQLTSPHGQRAVSLQERQMEMLRERIKGLEMKIVETGNYDPHPKYIEATKQFACQASVDDQGRLVNYTAGQVVANNVVVKVAGVEADARTSA